MTPSEFVTYHKYFLELTTGRNVNMVVYSVLIIIFVMLFKNFREYFINVEERDEEEINNALKEYGRLHSLLNGYDTDKISKLRLLDMMSTAYHILPKKILISILNNQEDEIKLKEIKNRLEEEIKELKMQQNFRRISMDENDIFDSIGRLVRQTGTYILIKSFVSSIAIMIILAILLVLLSAIYENKASIISFILIGYIVVAPLNLLITDLIFRGKIILDKISVGLIILLVISYYVLFTIRTNILIDAFPLILNFATIAYLVKKVRPSVSNE